MHNCTDMQCSLAILQYLLCSCTISSAAGAKFHWYAVHSCNILIFFYAHAISYQYLDISGLNAGSLYVMEFATKKLENARTREEVIVTSTS